MTMLAAFLVKPGRFELRNVPMPSVGDDQVLVKIARTGICGTDMHIFNGHYAADKLPLIPGHEFTGTVVETGKNVAGTKVGQSVVVDMNIGCGLCYWCRRNEILNCPDMQQMGISINGAFAEFIAVPARLVIAAPNKVPQAVLVLTEPLACVVRAARKARITFGQSVVVIGAGPIGNLHVQLLRTIGAAPIIVSDISRDRVRLALEAGADYGVTDPAELEATVMRATEGRGADIVIESVGHPSLYQTAMQLIRKGGHIAAFGLTGAGEALPVDILQTILEENSIKGSVAGMGQDMHDSLALLTHGRIRTEAFTSATFPLADIQSAFDSLVDRPEDLKTQIVM
ncbi:alcohol dehydrogenase catalytic domain-containing protein [Labrenzia sp. DG1229]|uniref:zinc-dependent alcohol dehydrogenase n=1 Tax=Labrenzia sp. DG1229 TaxID=681847 RepID=UPI00049201B7|nr:alcohol dehydrogenase catalytic domain-containing protein [Labrenzia sp. DG1229]